MCLGRGVLWLADTYFMACQKAPDIKLDDMDAGKRSERMSAVLQLVKILVGLKKSLWQCMIA